MRTTLDLDDDILQIVRELAAQSGLTMGQVISDLARKGLQPQSQPKVLNGVAVFQPKSGATKPSLAVLNNLRDDT